MEWLARPTRIWASNDSICHSIHGIPPDHYLLFLSHSLQQPYLYFVCFCGVSYRTEGDCIFDVDDISVYIYVMNLVSNYRNLKITITHTHMKIKEEHKIYHGSRKLPTSTGVPTLCPLSNNVYNLSGSLFSLNLVSIAIVPKEFIHITLKVGTIVIKEIPQ